MAVPVIKCSGLGSNRIVRPWRSYCLSQRREGTAPDIPGWLGRKPLRSTKNEKPACGIDPRCDDGINTCANNAHHQPRGNNERKPKRWTRLARIQTKRRGSGNGHQGCRPHKCHAKHRTRHRRRRRNAGTKIVSVVCACGQTALAKKPPALAGAFSFRRIKMQLRHEGVQKGTPWNVF